MNGSSDLASLLGLEPGPERTAAIASWIQGLYPENEQRPVLVGGAAVELFTNGGYTTGDLDFVGSVPPAVARALLDAGFERRGRHWVHEGAELFVEFPDTTLHPSGPPRVVRRHGHEVRVISPEALLADRLAAWTFWRSSVDAGNALLLLQAVGSEMDDEASLRAARELEVEVEWRRMRRFVEELAGRAPTAEEMRRWLDGG